MIYILWCSVCLSVCHEKFQAERQRREVRRPLGRLWPSGDDDDVDDGVGGEQTKHDALGALPTASMQPPFLSQTRAKSSSQLL